MHQSYLDARHRRDAQIANERSVAVQKEFLLKRQELQRMQAELNNALDPIEHRMRIESYNRQLANPIDAKMFPDRRF